MRAAAAIAVALALAAGAAAARTQAPRARVVGYGVDAQMTNDAPASAALSPASAPRLAQRWTRKLDGAVYAEPLPVTARRHRLVVVATQGGTVWALSAATGAVVWKRSLGAPISACKARWGIAATPAADESANVVYAIGSDGKLYALDADSGRVEPGWPVAAVEKPALEYVWSGLQIVGDHVYVAVASHCDEAGADGYLLSIDRTTRRVDHRFDVVPGPGNLGGIWGWGGVSVDPGDGSLFTATGNAQVFANGSVVEAAGHAERVVRLSPTLKLLAQSPAPAPAAANRGDDDLGSTPLLFRPAGCPALAAANSKNGNVYVWNRAQLARGPVWHAAVGPTDPDDAFLGEPSYSRSLRTIFVAQTTFAGSQGTAERGLSAYRPNADCSSFADVWNLNIGGGPIAPPLLVGDLLVSNAPASSNVVVVDARDGSVLTELATGATYAPPATDGSLLYTASLAGVASAWGVPGAR